MLVTLSEVEAAIRKVARAQGYEWGLAEEVGKSARWLAAYRLPGPQLAFSYLRDNPWHISAADIEMRPNRLWASASGSMCSVTAGTALADFTACMSMKKPLKLRGVSCPMLLVAMIGQSARARNTAYKIEWDDVGIACFPNGITVSGDSACLCATKTDNVGCLEVNHAEPELVPETTAFLIEDTLWQEINTLAAATYAPSSDASRLGAGAGLTDND